MLQRPWNLQMCEEHVGDFLLSLIGGSGCDECNG